MFKQQDLNKLNDFTFAFLEVAHLDKVLTITLNRSEKKNALHPVMANELAFALTYAKHNKDVWAVVLKANGDVFCAGADLKAFMTGGEETNTTVPKAEGEILIGELFNELHKPCMAQVEGDAFAGAFLLLCGCTQVVTATNVKFGLPEVKRGLFPYQVMASLLQVMPERKVLDWCIQGYNLDAQKAADWGLVTHIAEPGKVAETVQQMVDAILENSPTAIRMGLEAYQHIRSDDTKSQHGYLRGMLMKTVQTKDAQEGLRAFAEKRKPEWKNE
jgi:enoyl-CoA hydratase/carnithine racemase